MVSLIVLRLSFLGGCALVSGGPVGNGMIVSSYDFPVGVTSNKLGSRTGEGRCLNVLGLVATGDCSAKTIAQKNGITTISTVDAEVFSVLGLFIRYNIKVTGE